MSLRYDDLRMELKAAPPTWVPGLLRALIERAEEASVFMPPSGLTYFVEKCLTQVRTERREEPTA